MLPQFKSARRLRQQIDAYFKFIEGEYHLEHSPDTESTKTKKANTTHKVWDRESQPPTLCGLMLHLGFECRYDFELYEANGTFAGTLKRGRLRIEAEYEKRLHQQSPTGAIFALKHMGWGDHNSFNIQTRQAGSIKIEIIDTGYLPAVAENKVQL